MWYVRCSTLWPYFFMSGNFNKFLEIKIRYYKYSWIVDRLDLIFTNGKMISRFNCILFPLCRSTRNQNLRSEIFIILSCVCGGLSTLSKEQGITSLLICLLIDISHQYQLSYKMRNFTTAPLHKRHMILITWVIMNYVLSFLT